VHARQQKDTNAEGKEGHEQKKKLTAETVVAVIFLAAAVVGTQHTRDDLNALSGDDSLVEEQANGVDHVIWPREEDARFE
jgi:hypothetical protein